MAGELFDDPEFLAKFYASFPRLCEPPEGQRYYGDCYYRVDDAGGETLMVWFGEWRPAEEWMKLICKVEASAAPPPDSPDPTEPEGFVRVKFT